jgi:hypothetical protein
MRAICLGVVDNFGCNSLVLDCLVQSEEYSSSFLHNVTCHARGSKVQHVNAVVDAVNQTRCGFCYLYVLIDLWLLLIE